MQNQKIPFEPVRHQFLSTQSLHLATLLATIGAKPLQIVRGPEVTPQGTPKVTWTYEPSPAAEEVFEMWGNVQPSKDWEDMSKQDRAMCINVVSAFAGNLRHFLGHTKNQGKA